MFIYVRRWILCKINEWMVSMNSLKIIFLSLFLVTSSLMFGSEQRPAPLNYFQISHSGFDTFALERNGELLLGTISHSDGYNCTDTLRFVLEQANNYIEYEDLVFVEYRSPTQSFKRINTKTLSDTSLDKLSSLPFTVMPLHIHMDLNSQVWAVIIGLDSLDYKLVHKVFSCVK